MAVSPLSSLEENHGVFPRVTPRGITDMPRNEPFIHPIVAEHGLAPRHCAGGWRIRRWAKPERVPAFAEFTKEQVRDGHSNHTIELKL